MIEGISNLGGNESASTQNTKKTLGKEDFLTMLIAQLKNQDPLNPMNGTDFAVQLAQFSSLEQLYNVNSQLEGLASLSNAQLANMIGNEATAKGNTISVDGSTTTVAYNLSGDAQKVTITVYDETGTPVGTLTADGQKAGLNSVPWDTSGVQPGIYTFSVTAVDASGKSVAANTLLRGKVTGITMKDGVPYLSINGRDVAYGDVISFARPPG